MLVDARVQRTIAERLLLCALREHDAAMVAADVADSARHLAGTMRALAMSLDEATTRDAVRHVTLPRRGSWCFVDVVEANGSLQRLAAVHPDSTRAELATSLERRWPASAPSVADVEGAGTEPTLVMPDESEALAHVARDEASLAILRELTFGCLLVVPFMVRGRVTGTLTFVSPVQARAFSASEIVLAGEIAAHCGMALDNAALYRQADTLRLAAESANRAKSGFLATMSHELRTPLNAIGGFVELIELGLYGSVTGEQRMALARVKANQDHLLRLITEILDFARIDAGGIDYYPTRVVLPHVIADATEMLGGLAAARGLTIELSESDPEAIAWADADRVRQIIVNLVTNAVKYGSARGGAVTLRAFANGEVVVLQVADDGPGIPAHQMETIFEPFVQLNAGLADRRDGVGLGLAISRELAVGMKGTLTVESTIGAGSRFTLSLPRAVAQPVGSAA